MILPELGLASIGPSMNVGLTMTISMSPVYLHMHSWACALLMAYMDSVNGAIVGLVSSPGFSIVPYARAFAELTYTILLIPAAIPACTRFSVALTLTRSYSELSPACPVIAAICTMKSQPCTAPVMKSLSVKSPSTSSSALSAFPIYAFFLRRIPRTQ